MTTISGMDSRLAQTSISKSKSELSSVVNNLVTSKKTDANVADFSVGTVLSTKVGVLKTATLNAGQAKSLLATAKGGLETINTLLTKQKNLATKASDDSLSDNERGFLNQEFQSIKTEVDRIATNTNFNGKKLLDGSISGKASGTSTTSETVENFTLDSVGQFRLAGTVASGYLATSSAADTTDADTTADGTVFSTFTAVASANIGVSRAEGVISIVANTGAATAAVTGAQVVVNGSAVSFDYTETNATTSTTIARTAVDALNASTDTEVRKFNYELSGDKILVRARDAGTAANSLTLRFNEGTGITGASTATLGTNSIFGTTSTIGTAGSGTAGTARSGTGTFDANLQGNVTDISATLSQQGSSSYATFTAKVNGVSYTSNAVAVRTVQTHNTSGTLTASVAQIDSGQDIVFYNANGTKDNSGNLTDNGFKLTLGSNDVTVAAATGATLVTNTAIQDGLNQFADDIELQLAGASIVQERSISTTNVSETDVDIKAAVGTVLEGLTGYNTTGNVRGALRVRTDTFGSDGSFGSIGKFSYNKDTFKLTTTVDGKTFTADLSDSTAAAELNTDRGFYASGGGSSFSTTNKNLTLSDTTTAQIILNSDEDGDGKQIIIELENGTANATDSSGVTTTSIDLSTDTAADNFASALSALFGAGGANSSLNFQVGTQAEDAIGVSIGAATTSALYKDDDGVTQDLDISTLAGAQAAGDVLDNAINDTISLLADVNAVVSSFDAAISNNEASLQNADAARSVLLDTDYSQESTRYAETTVKYDAAASILAQVNQRMQNLLQLLRF